MIGEIFCPTYISHNLTTSAIFLTISIICRVYPSIIIVWYKTVAQSTNCHVSTSHYCIRFIMPSPFPCFYFIPGVVFTLPIDGSTDRCCIASVTNERALLSGSDQPVRKLGRRRILYVSPSREKTNFQRPPHLHSGIWCIVNVGNAYELNNKVKLTEIYRQCTA